MNNNKYLVSIIIPCYNAEHTVFNTLSYLEKQTDKDFEVIIVNDGSTDSTDSIIQNFIKNTRINIKFIMQNNGGVSAARNKGINVAEGKYILFLDADDFYSPILIESIRKNDNDESDVLYFRFTRSNSKINEKNINFPVKNVNQVYVLKDITYKKKYFHTSAFVYKNKIIHLYDIKFDLNLKYGEDWAFTSKYLVHCKLGIKLDSILLIYSYNNLSAMQNITYNQTDAVLSAINTEEYLKLNDCPFYSEFKEYMKYRVIFSLAVKFIKNKKQELFNKFNNEYDIRQSMKKMLKNKTVDIKVKIISICYLINPNLFKLLLKI